MARHFWRAIHIGGLSTSSNLQRPIIRRRELQRWLLQRLERLQQEPRHSGQPRSQELRHSGSEEHPRRLGSRRARHHERDRHDHDRHDHESHSHRRSNRYRSRCFHIRSRSSSNHGDSSCGANGSDGDGVHSVACDSSGVGHIGDLRKRHCSGNQRRPSWLPEIHKRSSFYSSRVEDDARDSLR